MVLVNLENLGSGDSIPGYCYFAESTESICAIFGTDILMLQLIVLLALEQILLVLANMDINHEALELNKNTLEWNYQSLNNHI